MKHCVCLFALLIFSCSTPRYTYYFDQYSEAPKEKHEFALQAGSEAMTASNGPGAIIAVQQMTGQEELVAIAEKSNALPVTQKIENRKQARRELRTVLKEFKKAVKEPSSGNLSVEKRTANRSNNGFAIAGFVLSLLSWFVLWPLAILGIIFSAIGLNSEKRGFAIAGLIIGIIGILLILIAAQNGSLV